MTFRYKPSGTQKVKTRTVTGSGFVRGFTQHTLPSGFQKIRHYGWMSSNCRVSLDEVKWLVWLFLGWTYWLASGHAPQETADKPSVIRCAKRGGRMHVIDITFTPSRQLLGDSLRDHALAYLDSG